jgi:predicted AAA+ superfamily ATPase
MYYHKRNIEVDFYVPSENLAVQVSYSIEDEATRRQEIDALVQFEKYYSGSKPYIVTYNEEQIINEKDIYIQIVPV